ncbi:MAG: hypothetical protein CL843_11115 [Crocinitomicaceae bacterium]|nr:hypothetical protein [Crocinitomicaceae bacterium]
MKKYQLTLVIVFIVYFLNNSYTQTIISQGAYGGEHSEASVKALKISATKTILAGISNSHLSGTHQSTGYGFDDYWVVCLENGNVLWERAYGGNDYDYLNDVALLSDGSVLLAGYSYSDSSGIKTENSRGESDLWLVKIDTSGTVLWERTIGGDSYDMPEKIIELTDQSILVICSSSSSISGEKTLARKSSSALAADAWTVKIDPSTGGILDQFLFGSESSDYTADVILEEEKLIFALSTMAGITGDKTIDNIGGSDFWIVEYDMNSKQILNQQVYGGVDDEDISNIVKVDDEYILIGMSRSGVSGDKSTMNYGETDIWLVKIDQSFNIIDQASFGGIEDDITTSSDVVFRSLNHQIIIAAGSNSPSGNGGTKTSPNYGEFDGYVLGINAETLEQRWDISLGGTEHEQAVSVIIEEDNDISILCSTNSSESGNKTVPLIGETDYWFVQLGNTTGVEDLNFDLEKVLVYPNPSRGYIYIQNAKLNSNYSVFDVTGQLIQQGIISSNNQEVELQTSTVGILFIQLENTAGGFQTLKLVRD